MGIFKIFVKPAQNKFESSVVKVRSDNGTEFRNTQVEEFCNDIGIKHEFSSSYTPQQNGVVERKNRTLITCNEHGTIYVISSDFGDRMTTQQLD